MAPLAMEFVSARARPSACQDSVLARLFKPFTPNTRAAPSGQGAREDGLLALRQAVHGPQAQAPLGTRSSTDLRASEATSGQEWRGLSATRTPSPVSAARTSCPPWRLERHPRFRGSNAVPTLAAQTPGQPSAACPPGLLPAGRLQGSSQALTIQAIRKAPFSAGRHRPVPLTPGHAAHAQPCVVACAFNPPLSPF